VHVVGWGNVPLTLKCVTMSKAPPAHPHTLTPSHSLVAASSVPGTSSGVGGRSRCGGLDMETGESKSGEEIEVVV